MGKDSVVIVVEGGLVSEVYTDNKNKKIIIVDLDNRKAGGDSIAEYSWPDTKPDNKRISELLNQRG